MRKVVKPNSHRFIRHAVQTVSITALLSVALSSFAQEEPDWWFDVEVIAFKRTGNDASLTEDFSKAMFALDTSRAIDLISPAASLVYQSRIDNRLGKPCEQPSFVDLDMSWQPIPDSVFIESSIVPDSLLYPSNTVTDSGLSGLNVMDEIPVDKQAIGLHQAEFAPIPDIQSLCNIRFTNIQKLRQRLGLYEFQYPLLALGDVMDSIPLELNITEREFAGRHYLLNDAQFNLIKYAKELDRQRNVKKIAHVSWRQRVVFDEENADFYRVVGGSRLRYEPDSPSYHALSEKYQLATLDDNNEDLIDDELFARIRDEIANKQSVDWAKIDNATQASNTKVSNNLTTSGPDSDARIEESQKIEDNQWADTWELDGQIKVYLKYVNRVPYLHLDNEFILSDIVVSDMVLSENGLSEHRFSDSALDDLTDAAIEDLNAVIDNTVNTRKPQLVSYPLKQRRRIVSKQIHYFDHPKLGLIIRLERFEPPVDEDELTTN